MYGSADTKKSKIHFKMNDVEIKQVDCWGQAAGYQPRPQAGG